MSVFFGFSLGTWLCWATQSNPNPIIIAHPDQTRHENQLSMLYNSKTRHEFVTLPGIDDLIGSL